MKKALLISIGIGILIVAVWLVLKSITNKVGKDINAFYHPYREKAKQENWQTVDFTSGDYALYIKHKTAGEFIVTDAKALAENQSKLNIDRSWANWLPGEGNRSYGIYLFKNKQRIAAKTGAIFNHFDIGDLAAHGIPVKTTWFSGVKREMQQLIDSLAQNPKAYILSASNLPKTDREFSFRVYLPSVAYTKTETIDSNGCKRTTAINGVPYQDWIHREEGLLQTRLENKLHHYISQQLGDELDYALTIGGGSSGGAYVLDSRGNFLQQENKTILINNLIFYHHDVHINANKETATAIKALDFNDILNSEDRNESLYLETLKQLKTQYQLGEATPIRADNYRETVTKSKALYEQEYQLRYLEIEPK